MNSFSLNRFGRMLSWVLSVNFRSLLAWTLGSLVSVFVGEMFLIHMIRPCTPEYVIATYEQVGGAILGIISVFMMSTIVSSINEKRKRETFLMLPGSNLEKFVALLVYTSVICVACILMAVILGDMLRMAWFWVSGPYNEVASSEVNGKIIYWWSSAIPGALSNLAPNVQYGNPNYTTLFVTMELTLIGALFLWVHSLLILGGTLLRKYSFIITCIFFILCGALFAKFMHAFELSMFTTSWDDNHYVTQDVGTVAYVLAVVLPIFSIINYWASFHIFKRFELITNKWMNYDFHK